MPVLRQIIHEKPFDDGDQLLAGIGVASATLGTDTFVACINGNQLQLVARGEFLSDPGEMSKLKRELADAKTLLAHKNETATTFMNQVRKLQSVIAAHNFTKYGDCEVCANRKTTVELSPNGRWMCRGCLEGE